MLTLLEHKFVVKWSMTLNIYKNNIMEEEQYRKEAINQSVKPIPKIKQRY